MTFSLPRALIFLLIGLPIGFILVALAFASIGQEIVAPAIAPWALGIAALIGLTAGVWSPED